MRDEQMEIEAQIAALQEKAAKIATRRKKIGENNWAADKYHTLVCHWDHVEGCGYGYDSDDMFDRENTAKNKMKVAYLNLKEKLEKIAAKEFTHEEALQIIQVVEKN